MKEWRSDEERARDEADGWKIELEAWLIGICTVLIVATVIRSYL